MIGGRLKKKQHIVYNKPVCLLEPGHLGVGVGEPVSGHLHGNPDYFMKTRGICY